jgi:hypothetical protein
MTDCPHQPSPDELASLREESSGFRIWREAYGEHIRYVAQRVHPAARPHTVVTADPAELRAALSMSSHPAPGHEH